MIDEEYNKKRPLITIRSDLPQKVMNFIKELKRLNQGSRWINEAIGEKYSRELKGGATWNQKKNSIQSAQQKDAGQ